MLKFIKVFFTHRRKAFLRRGPNLLEQASAAPVAAIGGMEPFAFKRRGFGNSVTAERGLREGWGGESAEEERKRPPGN